MRAEKLYVLGHPVGHSKSPAMYNAAFQAMGLKWEYGFADIESPADARRFVNVRNWRALNVTMPYKPMAFEVATVRSAAADVAQGANVLVNWGRRVYADNTDGKGCAAYLRRCGVQLAGARVAVCGTGPTARAIMHAFAQAGASRVALFSRDGQKALHMLAGYRDAVEARCALEARRGQEASVLSEAELCACAYADGAGELAQASVIVDATPLGMKPGDPAPFDTEVLSAGQTVLDVVYGHGESALLHAARESGCAAYDGAGMLVAQAVETVRDLEAITGAFAVPAHMDLFALMSAAAGFDL